MAKAKEISEMTEEEVREYAAKLKGENEKNTAELTELRKSRALQVGVDVRQGYLITTPNAEYSGITGGVMFVKGRGFVAGRREDNPGVDAILRTLAGDYGYTIRELDENGVAQLRQETATIDEQINAGIAQRVQVGGAEVLAGGAPDLEAIMPKR